MRDTCIQYDYETVNFIRQIMVHFFKYYKSMRLTNNKAENSFGQKILYNKKINKYKKAEITM